MSHLASCQQVLRIVVMLSGTGLLAACGYKGPLYLPPPSEPATAAATKAPTPETPAPAIEAPTAPSPLRPSATQSSP